MRAIFYILGLAMLLISCGSDSSNVDGGDDGLIRSFRIVKVVEISDDIYTTNYEYNDQNLLSKKITFYNDTIQDTQSFTYNSNKQLTLQSILGNAVLFSSVTSYTYGDTIYDETNLPTIVSSDTEYAFMGTISNTHIDYNYDLNDQNRAIRLNNAYLYYTSTVSGTIDRESTTYYTYNIDNKIIAKDDIIYTYNESGKLASSSSPTHSTIYTYDIQNRLSFYENYNGESLVSRVEYYYEEGIYDDSGFAVNYLDQGQYISSGIY